MRTSPRHVVLALCLALGACTRSCSCGAAGGPRTEEPPTGEPAHGTRPGAGSSRAPAEGAAGTTAPVPAAPAPEVQLGPAIDPIAPAAAPTSVATASPGEPAPAAPVLPANATLTEVFPDLQKASGLAPRLQSARKKLAGALAGPPATAAQLAPMRALARTLPASISGLRPQRASIEGPARAGDFPIAVASQLYKRDAREVYVKISDTAAAPFMREPVVSQLEAKGTSKNGYLHGRFVSGFPAIASYYPAHASSQLSVLVHGRYVVEVRVLGAASPDEAQRVFEALPLKSLPAR